MHKPMEPENIQGAPEEPSIKTEEMMSTKLEEEESTRVEKASEPSHDDEPILPYPR